MNQTENYINYVMEQIENFKKQARLIDERACEVTPYQLNSGLANYTEVGSVLNMEYQRVKIELSTLTAEHLAWYDEKFVNKRKEMQDNVAKSTKISVREIDSEIRVQFKEEYQSQQALITDLEHQLRFLLRLQDQWKLHLRVLESLGNNMRVEIRSLSVENRINNTEGIKKKDPKGFPVKSERLDENSQIMNKVRPTR